MKVYFNTCRWRKLKCESLKTRLSNTALEDQLHLQLLSEFVRRSRFIRSIDELNTSYSIADYPAREDKRTRVTGNQSRKQKRDPSIYTLRISEQTCRHMS